MRGNDLGWIILLVNPVKSHFRFIVPSLTLGRLARLSVGFG